MSCFKNHEKQTNFTHSLTFHGQSIAKSLRSRTHHPRTLQPHANLSSCLTIPTETKQGAQGIMKYQENTMKLALCFPRRESSNQLVLLERTVPKFEPNRLRPERSCPNSSWGNYQCHLSQACCQMECTDLYRDSIDTVLSQAAKILTRVLVVGLAPTTPVLNLISSSLGQEFCLVSIAQATRCNLHFVSFGTFCGFRL